MPPREGREARVKAQALYTDSYRRERRRHGWGWLLVAIGIVMGAAHIITHLGRLQFLPSAGWQDLLVGYPTAGAIALVGFALITTRAKR